jgi:hypothetical protein
MIARTLSKTVVFSRPFLLKGIDRMLPAGDYRVVTDEELIFAGAIPKPSFNRIEPVVEKMLRRLDF